MQAPQKQQRPRFPNLKMYLEIRRADEWLLRLWKSGYYYSAMEWTGFLFLGGSVWPAFYWFSNSVYGSSPVPRQRRVPRQVENTAMETKAKKPTSKDSMADKGRWRPLELAQGLLQAKSSIDAKPLRFKRAVDWTSMVFIYALSRLSSSKSRRMQGQLSIYINILEPK